MWKYVGYFQLVNKCIFQGQGSIIITGTVAILYYTAIRLFVVKIAGDDTAMAITDKTDPLKLGPPVRCSNKALHASLYSSLHSLSS